MTRKRQAGQALIAAAAILGIVLMGFAGLGIDMGYMRYQKRLEQTAADSAALAGAAERLYSPASSAAITTAARNDATTNGFTNGANGVTVTVSNPPQHGPHAGTLTANDYVEVTVSAVQPTFFMRILGINSETVTARAVATDTVGSSGCIYVLGTSPSAMTVIGGSRISAPSCGVIDDGGLQINNGGAITAASIGVALTCPGGCAGASPAPTMGIVTVPDPLSYLTPPSVGSPCSNIAIAIGTGTTTLNPGTYCSINIGVSGSANVIFNPGVYVITGNFTATNGATLNGTSGVMFYETGGTVTLGGGGGGGVTMNLTAPTTSNPATGAAAGILFWQDKGDLNPATIDNNTSNLTGGFYFPKATINIAGGVSTAPYSIVVAQGLNMSNGTSLTTSANYSTVSGGSPIKDAVLVE